ncbi:MAG: hypothetical protein JXN65_02320 [Clostridia bacterium]|nr:hypothetical protein [Clostridia bacterium]
MSEYLKVKRKALGLDELILNVDQGDIIWDAGRGGLTCEMQSQFLDKAIAAPRKSIIARDTLSIFDEYDDDKKQAVKNLEVFSDICKNGDAEAAEKYLTDNPMTEWFSFVFLDEGAISNNFYRVADEFSEDIKKVLDAHIEQELKKLYDFHLLLDCLRQKLSGAKNKEDI